MSMMEQIAAWSSAAQALIALVAALFVWYEYNEHKKARRADLAISLVAQLGADELVDFAVTSLDWGAGLVVAPPSWRDILENRKPVYSEDDVEDALAVILSATTESNPLRLLYRHAFVRLFDHLQLVALHAKKDPELLAELEAMAFVAHRLCRPEYVQTGRPITDRNVYKIALAEWYPSEVLAFVEALDRRFQDKEA